MLTCCSGVFWWESQVHNKTDHICVHFFLITFLFCFCRTMHFLAKAIVSPWPFAFMTWYIKAHIYHYIQNGVCTVGVHSNEVTGPFPASPKAVHRLIYFNAIYFNVFHDSICIQSCSCLMSATLPKYYSLFVQFQLKHSATPFCIFVIYFDNTIISIMLEMKER